MQSITSIFFLIFITTCLSKSRFYDFEIDWINGAPDGFMRPILSVNKNFPSPTILVNIGDEIIVNVTNQLITDFTILHWHGLLQKGTQTMDGALGVTSCGIPPLSKFQYKFIADSPGTYWYHSHHMGQTMDGLRGAFIVQDNQPIYKYDKEYVLELCDWYHNLSSDVFHKYFHGNRGLEPVPDAILINGKSCKYFDVKNCSENIFTIAPDSVIRLRLINTGTFGVINFAIFNHSLTIIEVDGTYTQPKIVESLRINVGQRYSVLIYSKEINHIQNDFWVQISIDPKTMDYPSPNPYTRGILHYDVGVSPQNPPISDLLVLDEIAARSFLEGAISIDMAGLFPYFPLKPPPANRNVEIDVQFRWTNTSDQIPYVNGITYIHINDTTDINYVRAKTLLPYHQIAQYIDSGDVVDIIINNLNNDFYQHPLHLHGHKFFILGVGDNLNGTFVPTYPLNEENPIFRDTATINPLSWMVLRIIADNPGVWMMHCHIDLHLEAGQALVFVESVSEIIAQYGETPELLLCSNFTENK